MDFDLLMLPDKDFAFDPNQGYTHKQRGREREREGGREKDSPYGSSPLTEDSGLSHIT